MRRAAKYDLKILLLPEMRRVKQMVLICKALLRFAIRRCLYVSDVLTNLVGIDLLIYLSRLNRSYFSQANKRESVNIMSSYS